jgi:branched-chain amino acid transport system permease protein
MVKRLSTRYGKTSGLKLLLAFSVIILILALCPQFLPRFFVYLLALILISGLQATSLNVALGYGGMYQFHHAVFFGIGAYTVSIMLMKTNLPPALSFLAGPMVAAMLGFVMGLICVRVSKLYFGMLQLSLGSLVWIVVFRWYSFTGGDDGLHGVPVPSLISSVNGSYYFALITSIVSLFMMYVILNSPFGRILQAIRDNPKRSEGVGVRVKLHQLVTQVIAAFFAGVAGVLFVTVEGSAFPDLLSWTLSLEFIIMCLLGGWFTFLGPMLGAAIIVSLRTLVGVYTEYWTFVLAVILMLLIFFLPEGALGYFQRFSPVPDHSPVEDK